MGVIELISGVFIVSVPAFLLADGLEPVVRRRIERAKE